MTSKVFPLAQSFCLRTVSIELAAVNLNYRRHLPACLPYEYIKMIHPSAENNVRGDIN